MAVIKRAEFVHTEFALRPRSERSELTSSEICATTVWYNGWRPQSVVGVLTLVRRVNCVRRRAQQLFCVYNTDV